MSILSFFSKVKNKTLDNPKFQEKFQQSWNVHAAAFGPILEPAFEGNMEARTHLVAALNQISRNECEKGLQTLNLLKKHVTTDADKAAMLYFAGLAHERGGNDQEAISHYISANQFGHDLFLPYLKVARQAHDDMEFAIAEDNYRSAIRCLEKAEPTPQHKAAAAAACSNLAGCLTYMHRYDEAEAMLARSAEFLPVQPGRESIRAMLAAAQGDSGRVEAELAILQQQNPALAENVREHTDAILAGKDPHFAAAEADREALADFWRWFHRNETTLFNLLRNKNSELLTEMLQQQLNPIFTHANQRLSFGVQFNGKVFELNLCDHYSRSVNSILEQLLSLRPDILPDRWAFRIIHTPYDNGK